MGADSQEDLIHREANKVREDLFPQLMATSILLSEELHAIGLGLGVAYSILDSGDLVKIARAIRIILGHRGYR